MGTHIKIEIGAYSRTKALSKTAFLQAASAYRDTGK
jgi:hypothetical protein